MESVEASGRSIEDAILQALVRLGRNRDEVDIQVLQEPSRGNRGMGVREARVRVFVRERAPLADLAPEDEDGDAPYLDDDGDLDGADDALELPAPETISTAALRDVLPEDASIEEVAVTALETMLALMGVAATVEVPEMPEDEPLILDIVPHGAETASLLIGRRGETLAALQLLVGVITWKQTGEHERITLDVAGYRARREANLRSMAQRVATQVRASGRPVTLEAMTPNERRIVHLELSNEADLSTESTGEGDQRHIVIAVKREARHS